nr:hypothetical protein Iba_chr04bCG16620 [Ipomoea batatas]
MATVQSSTIFSVVYSSAPGHHESVVHEDLLQGSTPSLPSSKSASFSTATTLQSPDLLRSAILLHLLSDCRDLSKDAVGETLRDRRRDAEIQIELGPSNPRRTWPESIPYSRPPGATQWLPLQPYAAAAGAIPEMGGLGAAVLRHKLSHHCDPRRGAERQARSHYRDLGPSGSHQTARARVRMTDRINLSWYAFDSPLFGKFSKLGFWKRRWGSLLLIFSCAVVEK